MLACAEAQAGGVFTVNSTGDKGDLATQDGACDASTTAGTQCTLRAAIEQSNAVPGSEDVVFEIPGGGVQTIKPKTVLPTITGALFINGYTQDGASTNTKGIPLPLTTQIKIFLDGDRIDELLGGSGLRFGPGSSASSLRGLAIGNFPSAGVHAEAPITVSGNFLGTNAKGTGARPNHRGFFGAATSGGTQIGGGAFDDPNLISGNRAGAIASNAAVIVEGNYIGTERNGKAPLPNKIQPGVGDAAVTLAGFVASDKVFRNIIAHTPGVGVSVLNDNPGSLISANRMFGNESLGIDLAEDGVTPNDDLDPDDGPNQRQNFPVITRAERTGETTTVEGVLNSVPNQVYIIEVFQADGRSRQGKVYLGGIGTSTGPNGELPFSLEFAKPKREQFVTATATRVAVGEFGTTSEFAKPRKVR